VQATAGTASQALRDNAMRMQQILQAATALGLQQSDIQTLGVNLYPLHPPPGMAPAMSGFRPMGVGPFAAAPEMAPAAGFRVDNTLRLTVREPNRAGEVLDAVVSAGATIASQVSFRIRDEAAARRTALDAAIKEARAKAEVMAAAMGRQLGEASVAIEEAPDPAAAMLSPGDLNYRARVRMRFIVR
jgi:uncharacterized protein YggE